jgi:hypothetical protein
MDCIAFSPSADSKPLSMRGEWVIAGSTPACLVGVG